MFIGLKVYLWVNFTHKDCSELNFTDTNAIIALNSDSSYSIIVDLLKVAYNIS